MGVLLDVDNGLARDSFYVRPWAPLAAIVLRVRRFNRYVGDVVNPDLHHLPVAFMAGAL
jgi:hypothetical protein